MGLEMFARPRPPHGQQRRYAPLYPAECCAEIRLRYSVNSCHKTLSCFTLNYASAGLILSKEDGRNQVDRHVHESQ